MAVKWRKLERPKAWRPKHDGEELVGHFVGKTVKNGQWGEYSVILIAIPTVGGDFSVPFTVTGTCLVQAMDAAMVAEGALIKIVYGGLKEFGTEGKKMKLFDVYIGSGQLSEVELKRYSAYVEQEEARA